MEIKKYLNKKVNSYFAFRKNSKNTGILEMIYGDDGLYCKCIIFNQLDYNKGFATHYIDYTNKKGNELNELLSNIGESYKEITHKEYNRIWNKFVDNMTNLGKDIKKLTDNNLCK